MVNVFKILWPKYVLYFLHFNKKYKIQYKQSCITTTRPVQQTSFMMSLAQNCCLHSAEVAVQNVHLSVCCGRI